MLTDETKALCDLSVVSGDTVYILLDKPGLTAQSQHTNSSELQSSQDSELKGTHVLTTSNFGSYLTRQKSTEQNIGEENEVDLLCNALDMMMLDSGFVRKVSHISVLLARIIMASHRNAANGYSIVQYSMFVTYM